MNRKGYVPLVFTKFVDKWGWGGNGSNTCFTR